MEALTQYAHEILKQNWSIWVVHDTEPEPSVHEIVVS